MSDHDKKEIPEKLPLLWRLTFRIFIAAGCVCLLGLLGAESPTAAIGSALSTGVFLSAGFLGLKRRPLAVYLSLIILGGTALQIVVPLLFTEDYVATAVHRSYESINAITGMALLPSDGLVSQVEILYWGAAIMIALLHSWMCLYLWRRRRWFAPSPPQRETRGLPND